MASIGFRLIRSVALKLLIALLLLVVFAVWIVATPSGARFALNLAAGVLPVELSVDSLAGSVWRGLELRGIRYADSPNEVTLGKARLSVDWTGLLNRRIRVRHVEAQDVELKLTASQESGSEPADLANLNSSPELLRAITIERLLLKNVSLLMGETRLDVPELTGKFALLADRNEDSYRLDSHFASQLQWEGLHGDVGLKAEGLLDQLETQLQANTNAGRLSIQGALFDVLEQARVDLKVIGDELDLKPLTNADAGIYDLRGALKGPLTGLSGELMLAQTRAASGQEFSAQRTDLNATFLLTGTRIKFPAIALRQASHPLLDGDLELLFRPDLKGHGRFKLNELDLKTLKSNLANTKINSDLHFEIQSDAGGQPVALFHLLATDKTWKGNADVSANSRQVRLDKLVLKADKQGALRAAGFLDLDGHRKFELEVDSQALDPATWAPELKGRLNIQGVAKGGLEPIVMNTDLKFLPGSRLHGQDLAGQLAVDYRHNRFRYADGQLQWGSADLELEHQADILEARFTNFDPGVLLEDLRAPLSGTFTLDTKPDKQVFTLEADAKEITYQAYSGRNLSVSADGPLADQQAIRFDLRLDQVESRRRVQKLENLVFKGTLSQHVLSASANVQGLNLQLEERGGYQDSEYRGNVDRLDLDAPGVSQWSLSKSAEFSISEARSRLRQFNLRPETGEGGLQLELDWDPKGEKVLTQGQLLPFDLAQLSGIGALENVKGELEGQWDLGYSAASSPLQGKVDLSGKNISVSYTLFRPDEEESIDEVDEEPGDSTLEGALEIASLEVAGDGKGASFDLTTAIRQNKENQSAGQLLLEEIPDLRLLRTNPDAWKRIKMTGQLQVELDDLAIISPWLTDLAISKGQINGNVQVAGRLAEPEIEGTANLRDLHFETYELDLRGQLQNAVLEFDHDQIRLTELDLLTPKTQGRLSAVGNISLVPENLGDFDFDVSGENVQVAGRSDLNAVVSPDLEIGGTLDMLRVAGSLTVEEAYIASLLNEGVTLSKEVVLERAQPRTHAVPVDSASGQGIKLDVAMNLADKVRIRQSGADVTLGGKLNLRLEGRGVPLGDGKLNIVKGSYKAYGQDLSVEKGLILFAGSPIDNPSLDISAVRKVRIGTVGVLVSGTAKLPRVRLQSEPAMPESEVLSWLVLGQPLAEADKGAASLLFGVGTTLLTDPDKPGLLERTQTFLDLDQLSIGSSEGADSTVVILGKQLSDKMYVAYEQGVLALGSTVRVAYQLTPAWALVARSTGFDRASAGTLFQVQYEKRF